MKSISSLVRPTLTTIGVFVLTAFVTFWAASNGSLFKSSPYTTRNAMSDARLSSLTNGAGSGILDGLVTKVRVRAEMIWGNPVDISKYNGYLETYLGKLDKLDNDTRTQLGSDYEFIFQYIYPRVNELKKNANQFDSIVGSIDGLMGSGGTGSGGLPDSFAMYQNGKLILKNNTVPFYTLDRNAGNVTFKWNVKNVEGCRMTLGYSANGSGFGPTSNDLDTDAYWMPATGEKIKSVSATSNEFFNDGNMQAGDIYYAQLRCWPKSKRWTEYDMVSPLDLNFISVVGTATQTNAQSMNNQTANVQTSTLSLNVPQIGVSIECGNGITYNPINRVVRLDPSICVGGKIWSLCKQIKTNLKDLSELRDGDTFICPAGKTRISGETLSVNIDSGMDINCGNPDAGWASYHSANGVVKLDMYNCSMVGGEAWIDCWRNGPKDIRDIDSLKEDDMFSCKPEITVKRSFDSQWQHLSWNVRSDIKTLSWKSVWPNGTQSGSALTTPLKLEEQISPLRLLRRNGWSAGEYTTVFTTTSQNGTVKETEETFTVPSIPADFIVKRDSTMYWQNLSWESTKNVESVSWKSTWPNGTQSGSALTTPLNQSNVFSDWKTLHDNGWLPGNYHTTWTVTTWDGEARETYELNEDFQIQNP